ncbi:F-box/LRR-repeat protein 2-like [Trifolium pratense]|uniref:F-box/LRR-repeat protein 2-like n=1 Tax=Trifolium pratense TaxID=57577 RepID=UPI001E693251|nr:F-box/LRR-repeat protein 2-like [Trifolium pratense]
MVEVDFNLPDQCWEYIFTFLNDGGDGEHNHRYLKSLSVVSKEFLSITNRLRLSLTICVPTRPFIHRLFKRFTNLTSLDLTCFNSDLNALLSQISCFRLNLTSLNISNQPTIPAIGLRAFSKKITTLTSLICSNIESVYSTDLFLIAECFPFLEKLDLSNPKVFVNQNHISFLNGLDVLSSSLLKLRKINLSGHCYVNDSSLLHLCKNGEFLEEVIMDNCWSILSRHGIVSAIQERRKTLRSLSIRFRSSEVNDIISSYFIDSLVSLKGLTSLDLSFSLISDELLTSTAMAGLPLRRLVLQSCSGYSYVGIFSLLSKCQSIQHLDIQRTEFLNDHHVVNLSLFLGSLVSINLSVCENLTNLALFALVRNCPSLSEISMEYTAIGKESTENSNSLMDFVVNPRIKSLHLAGNSFLRDESFTMFASMFPNLQLLDLNKCYGISEEGIYQILRRCCNIRHLNLSCCLRVKLHGMNFEVPKLKVLNLSYTSVDDETLYVISKNCPGLLQLSLERCINVTTKGVNHVVKNCMQLREINLEYCYKVFVNIVPMVFSRPSLRKITLPPHYHFNDIIKGLLSRLGCLIC